MSIVCEVRGSTKRPVYVLVDTDAPIAGASDHYREVAQTYDRADAQHLVRVLNDTVTWSQTS